MKKEKYNGIVSIWKFIFCIVIAIFHSKALFPDHKIPILKGGYIAVEFFFLVSGFYFAKKALKGKYNKETIGKETFEFIWKKILYFFPYVFLAVTAMTLLYLKYYRPFTKSDFINSVWNLLLIRQFGFKGPLVVGALWYLSVMLISMYILFPIVRKYGKNYIILISPLIAILGLEYLSRTYGTLDLYHKKWVGFLCTGTIRGFAEINIGMIMYLVNQRLKDICYTKLFRIILTILAPSLLMIILVVISIIKKYSSYDYVMLVMMIIAVQIIMSEKTYDIRILSNKFINYLGKLSLPVFINHQFFVAMFQYVSLLGKYSVSAKFTAYLLLTIIISIIEMETINFIKKKKCFNVSRLFIEGK